MLSKNIPGLIILGVLAAGMIAFFIIIALIDKKNKKARFGKYQQKFQDISRLHDLSYAECMYKKYFLPVLNGSIQQVKINYGLKYNRKEKKINFVLLFWRSDLDAFFPLAETTTTGWVNPEKSLTAKAYLAFGIYFRTFVPFMLRLKKNVINTELEKIYDLAGESQETVARFLTPAIQSFLISMVDPEKDLPFYLHLYYDEMGPAYGMIVKEEPLTHLGYMDDLIELVKRITGY